MKPYFSTGDDTLPPEQKTNNSLPGKPRNLTAHHISNKKKMGLLPPLLMSSNQK